ncbi:bifunctional hydroxyacyl-CoA dehydrogenase/enoyl-CoA hydratase [Maudiozyma humilis]|uniref:Peroxisomal hydratase-dehydrogenase-epimerase n=1 Tax=Maudiozyma humilis TaxID=51915 RepID=A0AAV5RPX2_MAUHU|nr:bifunctional hydroxyacyl-CoA dehydrogenase/enoyl-CoA hydratase [Kazachstania humilis]
MSNNTHSFKDRVVVITGAGGGLGKVYALEYAKRGAKVVVNDLGGSLKGAGHDARAADLVVQEIQKSNGIAVANYDSVTDNAGNIIKTAIDNFGRVDILINNAGILRDVSISKMSPQEFQSVIDVHLNGAFKITRAAWPYMRQQNFGRIINTCSPAGLFGNFGQANYSAAKLGLVGFAETLAKEGHRYNIFVNSIAPLARSRMTENVLPPHILKQLGPEKIVPLVLHLTHEQTKVTNSIFELAAGFYGQIRWERSSGQIFNPTNPASFTPEAILAKWKAITDYKDKDFNTTQHPVQLADYNDLTEKAKKLPVQNDQGNIKVTSLKNKVVIITGAGGGLGRSHALWFAQYGAKVVVNDIKAPDTVVTEINAKYGQGSAVADTHNIITESAQIIEGAIQKFGRVDVLVNNAGILRDRSFAKMTQQEWDAVMQVHLIATFAMTKAVWPVFLQQKGGYIINTTSTSGIYGNFGQANYAAAKAAILGFSKTLAVEGLKKGIRVNAIAPHAETAMTKTIFGEKELKNHFDASQVSPMVVLLASDELQILNKADRGVTGQLFEVGGGWCGQTRWERSAGYVALGDSITPELIRDNWSEITNFSNGKTIHPKSTEESSMAILQRVQKATLSQQSSSGSSSDSSVFNYTSRDCIIYNLGLGSTSSELKYVYENDPKFQVLPTFAVIPYMQSIVSLDMDNLVDNFNFTMLLHGEQYFKLGSYPLPTNGRLKTVAKPLQVIDKGGKAAVIVGGFETYDVKTKKLFAYNEGTFFIRGAKVPSDKVISNKRAPFATQSYSAPDTKTPDFETTVSTGKDQAALYRLSGDYNPLHIDPAVAKSARFPTPILHGLCTLGITAKALYERFGQFDELKVRFTNVVFPGNKLKVRAWKEGSLVVFQTIDVDRDVVVLNNCAIRLVEKAKL